MPWFVTVQVFVSNSERLRLEELADVLGKDVELVKQAMSNAVRMGFAVLLEGVAKASCATIT